VSVTPPLLADLHHYLTGADVDSLPLVVKVTTVIDVLEFRVKKVDFSPTGNRPQSVQLLHPGNGWPMFGLSPCLLRLSMLGADATEQSRPLPQGRTPLHIVRY